MSMSQCIDVAELRDYLMGKVIPQRAAQVEEHLQECAKCQSTAQDLQPADDSLLALLRRPAPADDFRGEAAQDEAVAAVAGMGTHSLDVANDSRACLDSASLRFKTIRDYQLERKLGEGGMGTVFLARHTKLDKPVALKVLGDDRPRSPDSVARFERVMKAIGKLEHPNIVRALDAGEEQGVHFLVMEFVDGVDVSRLIESFGRLSVPDACEIVRQAALGLQQIHEHGLVHRDIKPSNLMLNREGQVKILDLGLALLRARLHESQDLTHAGQVMGTLRYVSPEQRNDSRDVDIRSDIYSLGITTYELLGGEAPAMGDVDRAGQQDIRSLQREVPERLAQTLQRMLASDPAKRFSLPIEVASAVQLDAAGSNLRTLLDHYQRMSPSRRRKRPSRQRQAAGSSRPSKSVLVGTKSSGSNESCAKSASGVQSPFARGSTAKRWLWSFAGTAIGLAILFLLALGTQFGRPTDATGYLWLEASDSEAEAKLRASPPLALHQQTQREYQLQPGRNSLPSGEYEVDVEDGELTLSPSRFVVNKGLSTTLSARGPIPSAWPWQYPRLPDKAGAVASYHGQLKLPGRPEKLEFEVTMRFLGVEIAGGRPHCWLELQVQVGNHTEIAKLLIDKSQYETEQRLAIQKGWLRASTPIALRDFVGNQLADHLVVRFDSGNDALAEVADGLHFAWPSSRLSVYDVLALLVTNQGDVFAADPVKRVRAALAGGGPDVAAEDFTGPRGQLRCDVYKMEVAGPQQLAYSLYRNCDVPFGWVHLQAKAGGFEAVLNATSYDLQGAQSVLPPDDVLDKSVENLQEIRRRFERAGSDSFIYASLPEQAGHWVRYTGRIKRRDEDVFFSAWLNSPLNYSVYCADKKTLGDEPS